ncbi:hypothetical protein RCL1_000422 [Eukaryota sp. TZLM3-RCL]
MTLTNSKCLVCGAPGKYRCPACSTITCSLSCVNTHKTSLDCSGIAPATSFLKMSEMNDDTLMKDYGFLERVLTTVRTVSFTGNKLAQRDEKHVKARNRLLQISSDLSINLILMSSELSRAQANRSRVVNSNEILWHVEIIFVGSTTVTSKIPGKVVLSEWLSTTLNDPVKRVQIGNSFFSQIGSLSVLIQDLRNSALKQYFLLDQSLSLNDNLKFKRVIEFPTLYVCRSIGEFKIVPSPLPLDDEIVSSNSNTDSSSEESWDECEDVDLGINRGVL